LILSISCGIDHHSSFCNDTSGSNNVSESGNPRKELIVNIYSKEEDEGEDDEDTVSFHSEVKC
jgi:hypothetical protein